MIRVNGALPILVALASVPAAGCVSSGFYGYPTVVRAVDDRAYARGYQEGLREGDNDARRRRRFDYTRHRDYRRADVGYRGYGDRNGYRAAFRQGFIAGYNDGFRRYVGPGYGYPPASRGNYPNYPAPPYRGAVANAARQGYLDGYDQGRDDARDRDRYDPVRASRYREGDRGYDRRYGPREDYAREYRASFLRGYEEGYREFSR